jgi:hypothetical protein
VHEHHSKEATPNSKCLSDSRNFLWVYGNEEGLVDSFSRYGMNVPQHILHAIANEFCVNIVSEHEPQFWGYETQEQWDAAWTEIAKKDEQAFYNEVAKFARDESHDIKPDTIGMIKAEIAKGLIAASPELLENDKRPDLIKAVNLTYERDHAVVVELTDEDVAFVRMIATHDDDLSKG